MFKQLASLATGVLMMATGSAHAVPLDFEIDGAASSVTITEQNSGLVCGLTNCGISANLNAGLGSSSFSLDVGETNTFDFIDWAFNGVGAGSYVVEAVLAFASPAGQSVSATGGGAFLTFSGVFSAGSFNSLTAASLSWVGVPTTRVLADGSEFTVDFQGGAGIFFGGFTTSASVTVDAISAVPLPATLPLLLLAIGGLGFVGRRRIALN